MPNPSSQTHTTSEKQAVRRAKISPALQAKPALRSAMMLQRALADPSTASPATLLALQRQVGNQVVSRLLARGTSPIQAKLHVGPVADPYEQEADRVADEVVNGPQPQATGSLASVQRKAAGPTLQAKPLAVSITPLVQRAAEQEDENVQAQPLAAADGSFTAPRPVERHLTSAAGGAPLDVAVRADMENRFGSDFSGVRVHTGGEAVQLSRELGAKAFTHGSNIYFGANQYQPGSKPGKHLLAHELTHVIQQKSAQVQRKVIQRDVDTAGGTWKTNSYMPVPDGAQIELEFQPNDTVNAKKIGLIQKSLKVEKGINYDIEARRKFEAGEDQMPAQKRKAQRSEGRSHIDRDIKMNNPVYGAPNLNPGQNLSATPLGKLDMSDKAQHANTASNYQLGYRYKALGFLWTKKRSAKLWDKPNLPGALHALEQDAGKPSEMTFETTAVCLDGADKGNYYGSVEWGWKLRDPAVGVELLPLAVKSAGSTSPNMRQVMTNWNAGEFKDGEANPQIPLPA